MVPTGELSKDIGGCGQVGRVIEPMGQIDGERRPEAHQRPTGRMEEDAVGTGQGERIDGRARVEREADRAPSGRWPAQGRPFRVAVIS